MPAFGRLPASLSLRFLQAAALLAAAIPLAAQDKLVTGEPLGLFGDAIQVNVVNVEVYVTDKQGDPVTDLTVDDFEVFEDGQPVEITHFLAIREGRRSSAQRDGRPAEADASGPGEIAPRRDEEVDEDQRLRLVVFIDNFNLRTLERKRVMGQLRAFLRQRLRRPDQVMLASYERSLKIWHPFTDDVQSITEALRELDGMSGLGSQYDSHRRIVLERIDEVKQEGSAISAILPYADLVFHDLNRTIDVMRELVDHLAGLPGRKAVLHVSSGIPMVAAGDLFAAVEQKFETAGTGNYMLNYDASRRFEELGAHANAVGVTFYTLDAGGLRVHGSKSASEAGLEDARLGHRIDSDYQANLQMPLHFLADETGGLATVNQNEILPALERVAADFGNYYSLGYSPPHAGTGRLYSIRVKVDRKGVQVRHRQSYRDDRLESRMIDRMRAVLLHSVEDNPLDVELAVGRGSPREGGSFVVPIQVRIPVGRLVLVPRGDLYEGRVRLFVAALDGTGRISDVEQTPLGIRIPGDAVEAARGEHWLYTHRLLMRGGRQKITLGVRDELGAESSFVSRVVAVGDSG